jgi:hypothetical protein
LAAARTSLPCIPFAVLGIVASGTGIDTHPTVKVGEVTVIAAVGMQARVVSKVKVHKADSAPTVPGPAAVNFDRVVLTGKEALSLTAGALGAGESQTDITY